MCSACFLWAPGIPHLPTVPALGEGVARDTVGTGWNWGLDGRSLCSVGLGSGIPASGRSGEKGPHTWVGRSLRAGGDSHAWVGFGWMYLCSLRVGNLGGRIPASGRSGWVIPVRGGIPGDPRLGEV